MYMHSQASYLSDGGGRSFSSNYNFVVDENILLEAKKVCDETATSIETKITEIYGLIIDDLSNYWAGTSYDEFKITCEGYRDSLNQLVNVIRAYGELLNKVNVPRENLEEAIKNAINTSS